MGIDNKKLKVCPQITQTSVTDNGEICVRWTEVPEADKYAVQRSEKVDGEFERVAWAKSCVYIDKTVKENTTYWYRIVAVKELENKKKSKKTSPVTAMIVSAVPAPDCLVAESKGANIRLDWKSPSGINEFLVYRRNEHFNQLLPLCSVKGNKFIDNSAVQGQVYHYSVQSLCGNGQGNFSKEVSCVSLDSGEIVYAKSRFLKKVDLKARIVAGADGYIFERSEDGESFEEIAKTDSDVSLRYTDTVKKAFSVYYYRVKAYKNACGKSFISKPSKSIKVKTK